MILSMYINSDFSGWDAPETDYPIEWLIDYVRVYKDRNGYDENDRLTAFERYMYKLRESLSAFGQKAVLFLRDLFTRCRLLIERLFCIRTVVF